MSKIVNIGVLGCANIAQRFIIPALNSLNEFNLVGIASRSKAKAHSISEKFSTNAYDSYDSLLQSKNIDTVYIPLPNSLHYEWIKKSLNYNLHVIVEKSMTCSYAEVVELNNIAKEKNLVLIENFQFRFHSQLKYIKDLVLDGTIGELRNIKSSFGFPPFEDKENIRYKKELGGGALLDVGAYPLKISQMFMSNDVFVDSASLFIDSSLDVDIYGSCFLKDKNSYVTAQCTFGFNNFYQCNIELWGSKGRIYTNRIFTSPPKYKPTIEIETNSGKELITLDEDNHFNNMLLHFHKLILSEENASDEYQQNINQAKLIEEIKEKSK